MKNKKNIICFTNSYPYGNLETFFETELRYLSKAFHTLYIQPTYNPFRSEVQRPVPSNAVVFTPLVPARKLPRFFSGVLNLSPLSMYLRDFLRHKVYYSREKMKRWFNSFLIFRIKYRKAKSLLAGRDQNTILYSCWAEAPLFATKVCSSYPKVVRMHRGDFYLNVRNSYLPVRSSIYKSADLLLPISNDISAILQEHYRIAQEKILVNYVAVSQDSRDGSLAPYHNDILRIVSCSRVETIKRVHLIGETMMKWKCDRRIEWHHFGDGAEFDKLKRMTVDPPENVDIFLHGWVSQSYLYDFYRNNSVTWFISVSLHEGTPLSIIEAISFGIPAIATDAGATSEIVNPTNGYVLPLEITADRLAELISSDRSDTYHSKRTNAYATWKERFNAEKNSKDMIDRMLALTVATQSEVKGDEQRR